MTKYKIEINREECINCGACSDIDPTHFEPDDYGISKVVGGNTDDSKSSGVFEDDGFDSVKEAEDACPVSVITVTKL